MEIKRILFLPLLIVITGCLMSSCSNDAEFSLDRRSEDIATVIESSDDGVYSFIIGDSTKLVVLTNGITGMRPEYARVKINFTPLGWLETKDGYYIKLNGMRDILTLYIKHLDREGLNELPNDPVTIDKLSISNGYLNVEYSFPYGSQSEHEVGMYHPWRYDSTTNELSNDIILEFRHNANGDSDRWVKSDIVCFDLRSLDYNVGSNKPLNLIVRFNTPDGDKEYKLTYNPYYSIIPSTIQ